MMSLFDKEQALGENGDKMVQFGASELVKIATFPGRCPVGTSLGI